MTDKATNLLLSEEWFRRYDYEDVNDILFGPTLDEVIQKLQELKRDYPKALEITFMYNVFDGDIEVLASIARLETEQEMFRRVQKNKTDLESRRSLLKKEIEARERSLIIQAATAEKDLEKAKDLLAEFKKALEDLGGE